ncbi:MAG: hypothetical protein JST70_06245 [Bacteroidetes bacterium]|nr:hypothetical protein [Bacteroidota bacterium]
MKKPWWEYIDKPAYLLIFGGIYLISRNAIIGGIITGIGAIAAIIFFFMKAKNS